MPIGGLGSQIKFYCQQFNCDFSSSNFIDSLIIILNKGTDFENFQKTIETRSDDKYPENINLKIQPIQNISEETEVVKEPEVQKEEPVVSIVSNPDTSVVSKPDTPVDSKPDTPVDSKSKGIFGKLMDNVSSLVYNKKEKEEEKLVLTDPIYIYPSNNPSDFNFKFTLEYDRFCNKDEQYTLNGKKSICLYRYTNKNDILSIRQNKDNDKTPNYYIINYITKDSKCYKSKDLNYVQILEIIQNRTKIKLYNRDTPKQDDIELTISLYEISSPQILEPPATSSAQEQLALNPIATGLSLIEKEDYTYLSEVLGGDIPPIVKIINTNVQKLLLGTNLVLSQIDKKSELEQKYQLKVTSTDTQVFYIQQLISSPKIDITLPTPEKPECKFISPTNIKTIKEYYEKNIGDCPTVDLQTQFIFVLGVESFIIPNSVLSSDNNCIIQVASQYNFLESMGSYYSPIYTYFGDPTQGPDSSLSCLSALVLRDYLFRPNNADGYTGSICKAQPIFDIINNTDIYKNGYLQLFNISDSTLLNDLQNEENINELNMLFQNSNPIYNNEVITQVFTAAPSYQGKIPNSAFPNPDINKEQKNICKKLMKAQYESIAKFAVLKTITNKSNKPVRLHLTLVGQGAYNNALDTLNESFQAVIDTVKNRNVQVFIHIFSPGKIISDNKTPLLENIHKIFTEDEYSKNKIYTNGKPIVPGSNGDPLEGYYCSKTDFISGNITPKTPYLSATSSPPQQVSEPSVMFQTVSSPKATLSNDDYPDELYIITASRDILDMSLPRNSIENSFIGIYRKHSIKRGVGVEYIKQDNDKYLIIILRNIIKLQYIIDGKIYIS